MIRSYSKIYNIGNRGAGTPSGVVIVQEKVDGCVALDTPILMADLTYVHARHLKIGDVLVGFDESPKLTRLRESVVTASRSITKPCSKITFIRNGCRETIVASNDHPWLQRQVSNNNGKRWVTTANLQPGIRIVAMPYWEPRYDYEAGYIAGFFDGEGSLVRSKNQRVLSVYQRTGDTLNSLIGMLAQAGFSFVLDLRKRAEHYSVAGSLVLRGGTWTEILRFLGIFRPKRLLHDTKKIWVDAVTNYIPDVEVEKVVSIGKQEVQGLSTSTKTYVAKGLLSHNSQFSWLKDEDGQLHFRSKNREIFENAPEKMFLKAMVHVQGIRDVLRPGTIYRGEYLAKEKHNTLKYGRVPAGNLVLFDIERPDGSECCSGDLAYAAQSMGIEVVPQLDMLDWEGVNMDKLNEWLLNDSFLGGTKIEGVVLKNYGVFDSFGQTVMLKYVSEAFKETHTKSWRKQNPSGKDNIAAIAACYRTERRWEKAVECLRDSGNLTGTPCDIGLLISTVKEDICGECEEDIKEALWKYARGQVLRQAVAGLPEWYKKRLFEEVICPKD